MTKLRSFSGALAAGVLGSLLWVGSASAQLITIEVQEGAGPINGNTGVGIVGFAGSTANYQLTVSSAGDAVGTNAGTLGTNVFNIAATGTNPGTLFVRVTQQGNVTPGAFPAIQFDSGFTSNLGLGTQSATLSTLYDPANGLFSGTTLAQATFANIPSSSGEVDVVANPGAAFSVSNLFEITASAGSTGRFTVSLTAVAVPGPVAGAALPALLGMAGFWFFRRRRSA